MTGVVNSTGARSGVVGTITAPAVGTGTDGYVLTATGAGATPAWEEAAGGGVTYASQWRINANITGGEEPVSSNWEEVDDPAGFGVLGSSFSAPSSGVFTFPATGYWLIETSWTFYINNDTDRHCGISTNTTTNDSTYDEAAFAANGTGYNTGGTQYCHAGASYVFDVTNTSTHKCKFIAINVNGATIAYGHTNSMRSGHTFIRLGDT